MTEDSVNLDQMLDLTTPWCLMVAATLRIPDLIAEGHHDIADLATAAGCDRDALHAVLGHLVAKGVGRRARRNSGRVTPGRRAPPQQWSSHARPPHPPRPRKDRV
jgi:hypothetical protein